MRVSERMRYDVTSSRVEKAKGANTKMLDIISTQKKINKISDDPVALGQVVRHKNRISNQQQYQKNIKYSMGFIERTESAISSIHDFLMRAKELAVSMSNDTYDASSRRAAALEVKEIIEAVVAIGNTSLGNRYIFGGFRNQTPPISNQGQYVGDDGLQFLQIGDNAFKQINIRARNLFEASPDEAAKGHYTMINSLSILYEGLQTDDVPMVRNALDELDYQMDKTSSYQAKLGAIFNALNDAEKQLELGEEVSMENLSHLEDADIYKASSDFKRTETVLQSTLMASNKLLQPSLLNFLQ